MHIHWVLKKFDDLTPHQLYAILQLRNEVFVVEQACVFQDADGKDQGAYHLMGYDADVLVAYTRLLPPGLGYKQASIGRVVTAASARRYGVGKTLMQKSIDSVYDLYGPGVIKIGAQLYLKKFYESFGFVQTGALYLEDGIEHIHMLKQPGAESSESEFRRSGS
jgi:ElaA protein